MMSAACLWCGASFDPRESGGSAQRFCCPSHRRAFDQAARDYVRRERAAGRLTVVEVQDSARARPGGQVAAEAALTRARH